MIQLHPLPDATFHCPYCHVQLTVAGWKIPGMRTLADLVCPVCAKEYYGDLPSGHGLYYPMLLEKNNGNVHDQTGVKWFSKQLRTSYEKRTDAPVDLKIEKFRKTRNPILLNCLDGLYGHAFLKLLGADYYLTMQPDLDVIVLVPKALRWLVPDGVAEIWTTNSPLTIEWNEWLAGKIRQLVEEFASCKLGLGLSHPHADDFKLDRFTRVPPFPIKEWTEGLKKPIITFIWREDRLWQPDPEGLRIFPRANTKQRQYRAVIELFSRLKELIPTAEFNVVGLGKTGKFPDPIKDFRHLTLDDRLEQEWCKLYSQSICVIGVHGSNMLLPSALAGSVVELVPQDRWGNLVQDILIQTQDAREALFRNQFVPSNVSPALVATISASILMNYPYAMLNFQRPWSSYDFVFQRPTILNEEYLSIKDSLNKK